MPKIIVTSREQLRTALVESEGRIKVTAAMLAMNEHTLIKRLRLHGLDWRQFRPETSRYHKAGGNHGAEQQN